MVSGSEKAAPATSKGAEYVLKFVLCGDASVGKSQLVMRFSRDAFSQESPQTIGMEFTSRELAYYGGATLKAQIWDTAGQERFHSLTQAYYRGAVGAMLVYDMTSRSSFENMKRWLKQIKDNAHRNIAVSLIANKSDRADERVVSTAEGLAFAEAHGMDFVETSAALAVNVETAFRRLIMAVARLLPEGRRSCSSAGSNSTPVTPALLSATAAAPATTAGKDGSGEVTPSANSISRAAASGSSSSTSCADSSRTADASSSSTSGSPDEQQQQQQQQQHDNEAAAAADSDEPPPEGWVRVESKARDGCWSYENIWTGERVSERPAAPAIEYNTIQARALTHSVDVTGIGLKEHDRLNPVGVTCGNLSSNCTVC